MAGYGIAIPVGAIAVLIVEVGIRCGFRCAAAAGAGAATADLLYAGLAVIGGTALAGVAESVDRALSVVSAAVLVVIAVVGLRRVGRTRESVEFSFPEPAARTVTGTSALPPVSSGQPQASLRTYEVGKGTPTRRSRSS